MNEFVGRGYSFFYMCWILWNLLINNNVVEYKFFYFDDGI